MEGNFPRIGSSLREFRIIEGSRNRGENYSVRVKLIQRDRQLVRVIGRFEKPRVREIAGILLCSSTTAAILCKAGAIMAPDANRLKKKKC